MTTTNEFRPEADKKQVERSASYPGLTLEYTLDFVGDVSKTYTSNQIITRDDIAAVLNTKANNIIREVAAAAHFGLFNKSKEGYQITERYKNYKNPISESERKELLIQMFSTPKLFADLINEYNGKVLPAELKTVLIRFHKIAEKAAPIVAELFIENAKYVGVFTDDGILNINNQTTDNRNIFTPKDSFVNKNNSIIPNGIEAMAVVNHENKLLPEFTNEERVKVRLSDNKYGYIIYPLDINEKDIDILKKQIEVIELSIK